MDALELDITMILTVSDYVVKAKKKKHFNFSVGCMDVGKKITII